MVVYFRLSIGRTKRELPIARFVPFCTALGKHLFAKIHLCDMKTAKSGRAPPNHAPFYRDETRGW